MSTIETQDDLAQLLGEELLPLSGAKLANAVNRRLGAHVVTPGALLDAARLGAATKTGERVKLCAPLIGRRKWSSVGAVLRWIRACEAAR